MSPCLENRTGGTILLLRIDFGYGHRWEIKSTPFFLELIQYNLGLANDYQ